MHLVLFDLPFVAFEIQGSIHLANIFKGFSQSLALDVAVFLIQVKIKIAIVESCRRLLSAYFHLKL